MVRNSTKDARELEKRRKANARKTSETPFTINKATPRKKPPKLVYQKKNVY